MTDHHIPPEPAKRMLERDPVEQVLGSSWNAPQPDHRPNEGTSDETRPHQPP